MPRLSFALAMISILLATPLAAQEPADPPTAIDADLDVQLIRVIALSMELHAHELESDMEDEEVFETLRLHHFHWERFGTTLGIGGFTEVYRLPALNCTLWVQRINEIKRVTLCHAANGGCVTLFDHSPNGEDQQTPLPGSSSLPVSDPRDFPNVDYQFPPDFNESSQP